MSVPWILRPAYSAALETWTASQWKYPRRSLTAPTSLRLKSAIWSLLRRKRDPYNTFSRIGATKVNKVFFWGIVTFPDLLHFAWPAICYNSSCALWKRRVEVDLLDLKWLDEECQRNRISRSMGIEWTQVIYIRRVLVLCSLLCQSSIPTSLLNIHKRKM